MIIIKKNDAEIGKLIWQYEFDDVVKGTGTLWVNNNSQNLENSLVTQVSHYNLSC